MSTLISSVATAQVSGLAYPVRTKTYSGWTAIVKGDNNTIGMSGATIALPNSISAMESNPAGLAMNLSGLAAQINSFKLKDPELNRNEEDISEYQWGVGTSVPPWGFGVTYYSPSSEHAANSEVSVRQLRVSAARLLGEDFSLGVALQFNKGIRKFDTADYSGSHFSFQAGVLYKLGAHWVLGASFTPAIDIAKNPLDSSVQDFGFNQPIRIPSLTSVGVGFMPNRFFKAGFSLVMVSGTSDTALLWDQSIGYGNYLTLQPRLGASYVLAEYNSVKVELAMGSYYEVSRVESQPNRIHGTFGLDVNPWFVNTGIGADIATRYKSWSVSIGIDIVRTIRTFDLIPKDTVPPYNGIFPPPMKISANGLADGFTQGETKTVSPESAAQVSEIVRDIPTRLQERFGNPSPAPQTEAILHKRKRHKHTPAEPVLGKPSTPVNAMTPSPN
jgi:hypothetical protein